MPREYAHQTDVLPTAGAGLLLADNLHGGHRIAPATPADQDFRHHGRQADDKHKDQVHETNAPPPYSPVTYGNFQILPSPTAEPVTARIKARRDDQKPCNEVRFSTSLRPLFLVTTDSALFRRFAQPKSHRVTPVYQAESLYNPPMSKARQNKSILRHHCGQQKGSL